jgi:spoIIIJ-associated protein
MNSQKIFELVKDTLEELLPLMQVDADVAYTFVEDESPSVKVDFSGEELGYLIGSRGTHLKSLQYVTSLLVNRKMRVEDEDAPRVYVNMDVGGYRQEKVDQITEQAMQAPADRRIVHMALSEVEDIKTESHGEGRDRFVRVLVG